MAIQLMGMAAALLAQSSQNGLVQVALPLLQMSELKSEGMGRDLTPKSTTETMETV
jgi:hypothetical protein